MLIKIQALTFDVSEPYTEGHVLNAEEAQALNRCRADNINDKFSRKIKALSEGEIDFDTEQKIRKAFTQFMLEYSFPPETSRRKPKDQLTELAIVYAKEALREQSIKDGINWDIMTDQAKQEKAETLLIRDPSFIERAGKTLDHQRSLLTQTLSLDLFNDPA